jgi:hypothetical protein
VGPPLTARSAITHVPHSCCDCQWRRNLGSGCLQADVAHVTAELLLVCTQHSFGYNSQIKCLRTHVNMDIVLVLVRGARAPKVTLCICVCLPLLMQDARDNIIDVSDRYDVLKQDINSGRHY